MENWETIYLSQIAEINPPRILKRGTLASYVDMASLSTNGRNIEEKIEKREFNGSGSRFKNGDTLLARITPCLENGKTAFVTELEEDEIASGSTEFIIISGKNSEDNKFLYYLARCPEFRKYAIQSMEGTSGRQRVPSKAVNNFSFLCPPPDNRKAIAKILSTLDDKIELNRQMNRTLEQMAQALYKAWFVDFEFPDFDGNLIEGLPAGWRKVKIGELIDTVSSTHKFPNDKIVFLNTSDILDGQVIEHDYSDVATLPGQAKKSIKKHDILYSEIRPANKRHAFIDFEADDYVVSTKLMVLRAKSFVDPIVIYYFLKSDEIVNLLQTLAESRSGTFPQITFQQIKNLEMVVPTAEILKPYTANLKSYSEKIRQNNDEIRRLAEIRDALLPRLISGRIPVGVK